MHHRNAPLLTNMRDLADFVQKEIIVGFDRFRHDL